MDSDEKTLTKVSGVQSLSSSVQSTPEKNGHSDDGSRSPRPKLLQEFLKSSQKRELRPCSDKEKKGLASFKRKLTDDIKKNRKMIKKQEPKHASSGLNNQSSSKKQSRKRDNPMRLPLTAEQSLDVQYSNSWICKNSACRAVLSVDYTFCKRCSCCICHLFDDNKDPSLWLVCTSESAEGDSCGLSCHIECALQRQKVGVVDLGQLMQLDGSYCCASCGKVSGILGCWKKQLSIAKEARRVDVLSYRLYLCHRLLDGTSRYKELHEIIKDAKAKLETEVGPVNGISVKMVRGIVSRLCVASDVQKLCSDAIDKADEWLTTNSNVNSKNRGASLPAACKFVFEEVMSSYVVIIIIELSTPSSDDIKGYKLWYSKSPESTHQDEPDCVFPRTQRRIRISNLRPCTEYIFRIVSYTEAGNLGHSEAKCFTKSVEIIHKNHNSTASVNNVKKDTAEIEKRKHAADPFGFKVRDLGKILHLPSDQKQRCLESICRADIETCCVASKDIKPATPEDQSRSVFRGLDLNVVSVPDLNEELRDEDNGCTSQHAAGEDDDAASHDLQKNGIASSNGTGDSQTSIHGVTAKVSTDDSQGGLSRKWAKLSKEETHDCDSTLINGSPFRISNGSGCLDENFEYSVKIIRWLECQGHIGQDFRLKLLTWFSLRSTEQERRVVNTFIQTLMDDPSSLAGQLVDSFSDIVSSIRPQNGFCSKLWH